MHFILTDSVVIEKAKFSFHQSVVVLGHYFNYN